jgi:hypothetical protein
MENSETLPASAEEEREGGMDQSADQRLGEVLGVMPRLVAAVRVVVVVEERVGSL